MRRPVIGLIVPSLFEGGGVPAVARFIKDAIQASGEFSLKIISLATSARDDCSVWGSRPASLLSGIQTREGIWEGEPYVHVGAYFSELEFQRYGRRRELRRLLSECDLLQVVSGSPAWALTVADLGKTVVLQVATRAIVERRRRENVESGARAWWRWGMTRLTDVLDDRGLRCANAVLVENPWMLRYASEVGAAHNTWVRYAPPGIDCKVFTPRAKRDLLAADRYILSVGRFDDPRKNPSVLLRAFAIAHRSQKSPLYLLLAGAGDPGEPFWREVQALNLTESVRFHLRPTREELANYYRNAQLFALPSDEEGFGIVLVEAMASGVPVVATACGGPEGILAEGHDGFLIQVGDAQAMAERFVALLGNCSLNLRMGAAARESALRKYEAGIAGEAFLDTYRKLLPGAISCGGSDVRIGRGNI
jgi:glycosyltransferase involved in cell wall biosynthesis